MPVYNVFFLVPENATSERPLVLQGVAVDWMFSLRIKSVGLESNFWNMSVEGGAGLFLTFWKVFGRVSGRAGCLRQSTFFSQKL